MQNKGVASSFHIVVHYSQFFGALFCSAFSVTVSMIGCQVNDYDGQTRTNIHNLSRIQTHDLSVQAIKAYYTLDHAATGTSIIY
jgi:hypothetical protein